MPGKGLFHYTVMSYAFSWAFWLPQVVSSNGLIGSNFFTWICGFIAPFGPFVAAFVLTYTNSGAAGVRQLVRRAVSARFPKRWLLPVILFFPTWAGSAVLVGALTGGTSFSISWFSNPLSLLVDRNYANFAYLFVFVGVAEEFGWRGFALDRFQARYNALGSAVLLGLVWAFWHLPVFFIVGSSYTLSILGPWLAQVIVFSMWFSWLYNNTRGSILVAILFHTMEDLTLYTMFPVTFLFSPLSLPVVYMYVSAVAVTVVIVAYWGPKKLTHGEIPAAEMWRGDR